MTAPVIFVTLSLINENEVNMEHSRLMDLIIQQDITKFTHIDSIKSLLELLQLDLNLEVFGIALYTSSSESIILGLSETYMECVRKHLPVKKPAQFTFQIRDNIIFFPIHHAYLLISPKDYQMLDPQVMKLISGVITSMVDYYLLSQELTHVQEERDLRQSILDVLPEMIAVKNLERKYIFANKTANQAFSGSYKTVVNHTVSEIYPEFEVERIAKMDQEVFEKEVVSKEIEMLLSKGFVNAESERRLLYNDQDEVLGILTINRNITEKRHIEHQLSKSLRFQDILIRIALEFINVDYAKADAKIEEALGLIGHEIGADRVYVFDYDLVNQIMINTHEWCSIHTNPAIHLLKAVPIEDFLEDWYMPHERDETIYVPSVEKLDHDSNLYQILNMQDIKSALTIPLRIDNHLVGFVGFDAVQTEKKWGDEDQKLLRILAELIVHLKKNQMTHQEIISSRKKAEYANQAKSIFLANMSHEIRTPLSGLYNAISLIENSDDLEETHTYLDIAKASIDSLSIIINDILDLTRIENGNITLESAFFNLEDEVHQVLKMLEYTIKQKGLSINYAFDYRINHLVLGDRLRIRQMILNLMNNSIKFTHVGSIGLSTTLIHEDNRKCVIEFKVSDTGIGIPEHMISVITDRFVQVESSSTKNYRGVGLGLSIVKGILDYYHSKLHVESVQGQGSEFSFRLIFDKGESILDKFVIFDQKRAVLISDNDISNRLIGCIESTGLTVESMSFNKIKAVNNYDYIFLCLQKEQMEKIKFNELMNPADHTKTKLFYCKQDHTSIVDETLLSKHAIQPIDFPTTREKLYQLLIAPTMKQQKKKSNVSYDRRGTHILVVDDNYINRQSMEAILTKYNYTVSLAQSGEKALNMLNENRYDLILMDIQMPEMDGYMTTDQIRSLGYSTQDLPIIAVSANSIQSTKNDAASAGMNGFITKPFKVETLIKEIDRYCHKKSKTINIFVPQDRLHFNRGSFDDVFEGQYKIGVDVIKGFINDFESDVQKIKDALSQKTYKAVEKSAHYLKGSASYVAADRLVWILSHIIDYSKKEMYEYIYSLIKLIPETYEAWFEHMKRELGEHYE